MLKDELSEEVISRLGFCKIFVSRSIIPSVNSLFTNYFRHDPTIDMYATMMMPDKDVNLAVHKQAAKIMAPVLDNCFENYNLISCNFVVKKPNCTQSFQLHQDWNTVDERKYRSYQVWFPLELSYPEHGGICFIPQSHAFSDRIRSASFDIPRINIDPDFYPYLSYLRLLPGEAAVFHNSLFHGSFSNPAPYYRIVLLMNIIDQAAKQLYYHFDQETGNCNVLPINTTQLYSNVKEMLEGSFTLDTIPVDSFEVKQTQPTISKDELLSLIVENTNLHNIKPDYEHKQANIFINTSIEPRVNCFGFSIQEFPEHFKSNLSIEEDKIDVNDKGLLNYVFKSYVSFAVPQILLDRSTGWHMLPAISLNPHFEPAYYVFISANACQLEILPGSHRIFNALFPPPVNRQLKVNEKLLNEYSVTLELSAGQVLIMDTRLIVKTALSKHAGQWFAVLHKDAKCVDSPMNYFELNEDFLYYTNAPFELLESVPDENKKITPGIYTRFANEVSAQQIITCLEKVQIS